MRREKSWLIAGVVVFAIAVVAVVAAHLYRATTGAAASATDREGMARIESQRDLAAALKDPDKRAAALLALEKNKDVEAVELLSDLSHRNKDADVRAACLIALGDIGDAQGIHPLTLGCRDKDARVRLAAIAGLAKIGNSTCQSSIADALSDVDPGVRKAAATALSGVEGDAAAIAGLLKALTTEELAENRQQIVVALGRQKDARARNTLIRLLDAREQPDAAMRAAAMDGLLCFDDPSRVKSIICAIGDPDAAVRQRATSSVALLDLKAIAPLTAALRSGEFQRVAHGPKGREVLHDVLELLSGLGSPATTEALLGILGTATTERTVLPDVRDATVAALVKLGEPVLEPLAKEALQPWVVLPYKSAAAEVFSRLGAPGVERMKQYLLAWQVLPSTEESQLWATALDQLGGAEAKALAEEARKRDPALFFKQAGAAGSAESGVRSPESGVPSPAPAAGIAAHTALRTLPTGRDTGPTAEFTVVLHEGLYGGNPPSAYARRQSNLPFLPKTESRVQKYVPQGRPTIRLDLPVENGVWQRVIGHGLNRGSHFGKVTKAAVSDDALSFSLQVGVDRDPWVMGGYGEYEVTLSRTGDGTYEGAYTGKFHDLAITGRATGFKNPPRPPVNPAWRPVTPNEHPRMLFRAHELPLLRAKLNTPLGAAAFGRMVASHDPVCLGMLYQLTGDAKYAQAALPLVRAEMAKRDFGMLSLGQIWGPRWSTIALSYDTCWQGWTPEFREEVNQYLVRFSNLASTNMGKFSICANWHPCSNFHSPIQGGGAMMSLACWMDPGRAPLPPAGTRVIPLQAAAEPPGNSPVAVIVDQRPITEWLWSGPVFTPVDVAEFTTALGIGGDSHSSGHGASIGPANDRVQGGRAPGEGVTVPPVGSGTSFNVGGQKLTLQPVPPKLTTSDGIYPWRAFKDQNPDYSEAAFLLYTVLKNERAGFYQLHLPAEGEALPIIAGTKLMDGAWVKLEVGYYPTFLAFSGPSTVMSAVQLGFSFVTDDEKEMQILMDEKREHAQKEQVWYDLEAAETAPLGMDGYKMRIFQRCRTSMFRSFRTLMGDGGFQSEGEGYTHTAETPLRYAVAYWNMFGRHVTPFPDVTHFPFRYAMTSVLQEPGRGRASLLSQAFNGHTGIGAGFHFMVIGFPIIPEQYKPGVLWIWNKMKGVDPEKPETLANLVSDCHAVDLVYTFLNYPLDMKPRHPSTCFPRTYQARTKGLYVFRNQWQGADDIVFQFYANQLISGGHGQSNAAALRLYGLGYSWARVTGERDARRFLDNVVLLPDDKTRPNLAGYVTCFGTQDNGSGYVSLDLNDVYARPPAKGRGRGQDMWGMRYSSKPSGADIQGMRAVGVDYSGKSGAPALFAIVDKIEGGQKRQWVWHAAGGAQQVSPDGRTFSITQGDASLKGTLVAPAGAKVIAASPILEHLTLTKEDEGYKVNSSGFIINGEPGTSFFVVLTLQKGAAPEVVMDSGAGLDSVLRVGKQKVRFDGQKVLIGE